MQVVCTSDFYHQCRIYCRRLMCTSKDCGDIVFCRCVCARHNFGIADGDLKLPSLRDMFSNTQGNKLVTGTPVLQFFFSSRPVRTSLKMCLQNSLSVPMHAHAHDEHSRNIRTMMRLTTSGLNGHCYSDKEKNEFTVGTFWGKLIIFSKALLVLKLLPPQYA